MSDTSATPSQTSQAADGAGSEAGGKPIIPEPVLVGVIVGVIVVVIAGACITCRLKGRKLRREEEAGLKASGYIK